MGEQWRQSLSISNIEASGYGLAFVKPVVEKHNGKIWYESELGKGSTFYVELPVA